MKKLICLALAMLIFSAGCAGREANPVSVHQLGDTSKSCESLGAELFFIESEIARLIPKSDKTGRNIACGATGVIFIVPLFFMDLKQGEKIELEAYRQRYNYLVMIAKEKDCKVFGEETDKLLAKTADAAIGKTCTVCGHSGDSNTEWTIIKGELMCMDCYLKQKATAAANDTDS